MIRGTVDSMGRGYLVVVVCCLKKEVERFTKRITRCRWRLDRGPSTIGYMRTKKAVATFTSDDFSEAIADPLRHIICRMFPHAIRPKRAMWDRGTLNILPKHSIVKVQRVKER